MVHHTSHIWSTVVQYFITYYYYLYICIYCSERPFRLFTCILYKIKVTQNVKMFCKTAKKNHIPGSLFNTVNKHIPKITTNHSLSGMWHRLSVIAQTGPQQHTTVLKGPDETLQKLCVIGVKEMHSSFVSSHLSPASIIITEASSQECGCADLMARLRICSRLLMVVICHLHIYA